jgi:methionyl-tRNA formyltransferase
MRIVFFISERLITDEVFLYMFANVGASFHDVHVVAIRRPIEGSSIRSRLEKLRRLWRYEKGIIGVLEYISSSPIRRFIYAYNRRQALARVRALPRPSISLQPEKVTYVDTVNGPDAVKAISNLKPDVVIQVGAGILRQQIFEIARIGTLNLHPGIAPLIKGMNPIYWARWEREPRWMGATVHFIEAGIDTGPVLAYAPVTPVLPGESHSSLFVRVYESGVAQLVGTLLRLAQGERWTIQPPQGERTYHSIISGWKMCILEARDALHRWRFGSLQKRR